MKRNMNLILILILSLSLMVGAATSSAQDEASGPAFINHQGQDLWLSGINLAWVNFGFEGDVSGWVMADYWPGGKALEQSDAMASEGSMALKLTLSTSGTAWEEGGVYLDPPEPADWSAAKTVSADVYVPAEAEGFLAQIFVKTGEEWTWANSADAALTPGEWTTVTADLSALGNIADVREIGVKVGTSATAFEGDVFIDNIVLAE